MSTVCVLTDERARPHASAVLDLAARLGHGGLDVTVATTDDAPLWREDGVTVVRVADFGGRSLPRCDLYLATSVACAPGAHDTGIGIGGHLVLQREPQDWRIDFAFGLKTVKLALDPAIADHVEQRTGQPCRVLALDDGIADEVSALIAAERDRWDVRDERLVPGECEAITEAIHLQHYRAAAPLAAGRRVIDAGCGVGYGSRMLVDAGAASVLSLDYSEQALAHAREHYDHPAIRWQQADLREHRPEPRSADLVTCFEVFEHVEAPGPLMERLAAALGDDGRLVLSTPNGGVCASPYDPANVHHVREYDVEELSAILAAHFGEVTLHGQRLVHGSVVIADPDPSLDLCFVANCGRPRRRPAADRVTVVAAPDWTRRELWLTALDAFTRAFDASEPVTLELLTADLAEAEAALLGGLGELGHDPERIPDVAVTRSSALLRDAADRLAGAHGLCALGRDDRRLRRLAASFGVPVLDEQGAPRLAARLRELGPVVA